MGRTIVGVLGLAVRDNGDFLLTVRNEPESPEVHETWQIPGGGLEYGEHPEQTLVREFKEEIGVIPELVFPHPIMRTHTWESTANHIVLACYVVDIGDQEIMVDGTETLDYGWHPYRDIEALRSFPGTWPVVQEAQKILIQNK